MKQPKDSRGRFRGMNSVNRFWAKVDKRSKAECWPWLGSTNSRGYGSLWVMGKLTAAHRISWSLFNNREIPGGMFVLHNCDNPRCVNPTHLFLGTQFDNMRDCCSKGRSREQKKAYCVRGHPLSGSNLNVRKDGARTCRACKRFYGIRRRTRERLIREYHRAYDKERE